MPGSFKQANLDRAYVRDCEFEDCDFSGSQMVLTGWMYCTFVRCNFERVSGDGTLFSLTKHDQSSFERANLPGVDFSSSEQLRAPLNFTYANLSRANFSNFAVPGAVFRGATLTGARLANSDFTGANFQGARVDGADFGNSPMGGAIWIGGNVLPPHKRGAPPH